MKKMKRAHRGEGYIDTALTVFIVALLIGVVVNLFSLLAAKQDVSLFANKIIDVITTTGRTGTEAASRIAELKAETGLNPTVSYSGTAYMSGSGEKVQLGNVMQVTVTVSVPVKGLGAFKVTVPVKSTQSGLSKVYWK